MENENVDDTGDADFEFDEDEIVEIIEINEGDGKVDEDFNLIINHVVFSLFDVLLSVSHLPSGIRNL